MIDARRRGEVVTDDLLSLLMRAPVSIDGRTRER
jgi:hypothetical protein